ncbi:MAG: CBS domain-containing protein [Gemmatimonadales bacterium]
MSELEEIEDPLAAIAADLDAGQRAYTVSVRELLRWFGVRRRGYLVVQEIREALAEYGLVTSPDFEGAHIDSYVALLKEEAASPPSLEHNAPAQETPAQDIVEEVVAAIADPTFRLSRLPSANRTVAFVAPTDPVEKAVTMMLANSYSQLPVMTTPREVKGVVSWKSIGEARALRGEVSTVAECMDVVHERLASESVFAALPTIVEHDYVLVRGPDRSVVGIVTASDLSEQFRQLAEPFLLIGEIENNLRRLLGPHLGAEELATLAYPGGERTPASVRDLTFGQYHQAFAKEGVWDRLGLGMDQQVFCDRLDVVREIRNDVMHFDPDPFDESQLATLRTFATLLRRVVESR